MQSFCPYGRMSSIGRYRRNVLTLKQVKIKENENWWKSTSRRRWLGSYSGASLGGGRGGGQGQLGQEEQEALACRPLDRAGHWRSDQARGGEKKSLRKNSKLQKLSRFGRRQPPTQKDLLVETTASSGDWLCRWRKLLSILSVLSSIIIAFWNNGTRIIGIATLI